MDAETIAQLLGRGWAAYGQWKAKKERKDLLEEAKRVRAELEELKSHVSKQQAAEIEALNQVLMGEVLATIKQSAEIDALDSGQANLSGSSTAEEESQRKMQSARAETERLRNLLMVDGYNSHLRRLYLSSRTEREIKQDEMGGKRSVESTGLVAGPAILCMVIGGFIGFTLGFEKRPTKILGFIPSTESVFANPLPLFIIGLVGAGVGALIGIMKKSSREDNMGQLWREFGPIPHDLASEADAAKIREKLFGR
jgi:hypothetical protein